MINQSLEQINLTRERSLLMVKARWFLAALLLVYTTVTTVSYSNIYTSFELFSKFGGLFVVIALLVIFNAVLHWSYLSHDYLWRHKINAFVNLQLGVDLLCALAFIHFSGGVLSWFWTLLLLYTIELTYFLPTFRDILNFGVLSLGAYTILVFGEYLEIIPRVKLLFLKSDLQTTISYVVIVWFWVVAINIITAFISFNLRSKEEPELADRANRDSQTKLYNRKRFNDFLNSETFRAQRYGRAVSLMFFKIENLEQLLDKIGLKKGDDVLETIGNIFKSNLRRSDTKPSYDIDIACRYESDVFAVILPETVSKMALNPAKRIEALVKHECAKVAKDVPVTLSIGVAGFPENSSDVKSLVKAAQDSVKLSQTSGKLEIAKAIKPKEKV